MGSVLQRTALSQVGLNLPAGSLRSFAASIVAIGLLLIAPGNLSASQEQPPLDPVADGLRYLRGDGVTKDPRKAARFFQDGCDTHIAQACWILGLQYSAGDGIVKDEARAARLFSLACDGNVADACYVLADSYTRGVGVARDEHTAASFYDRACSGGNVAGCFGLGLLNANGVGVDRDLPKAAQLYDRACSGGHAQACYNLAFMFRDGQGVERNSQRSLQLFGTACSSGEPAACLYLGAVYGTGTQGVAIDTVLSAKYYAAGCAGGNEASCSTLGRYYAEGVGVPQDLQKAVNLYDAACTAGNSDACNSMAICLENGTGVARDLTRAAVLYERACSSGSNEGCFNLGLLKEKAGHKGEAAQLYVRACDAGNSTGCYNAGNQYAQGAGVEKNESIAASYFERSCDMQDPDACSWVAGYSFIHGAFAKAERYAAARVTIEEQTAPNSEELAGALDQFGNILLMRGHTARGEKLLHRALELRRQLAPTSREVAVSLVYVAGVAAMRADWSAAADMYQQAVAIYAAQPSYDQDEATAIAGLASALILAGDWEAGRQIFADSIGRFASSAPNSFALAILWVQQAFSAVEHGDLALAEMSARQAWSIFQLFDAFDIFSKLAVVALARAAEGRGDYDTAEDLYRQVLDSALLQSESSIPRADMFYRMGRVFHRRCELEKSAAVLRQAVGLLTTQHKYMGGSRESVMHFNVQTEQIYKEEAAVLMEVSGADDAFRAIEQYKAKSLVEMLAERELTTPGEVSASFAEHSRAIDAEYERLQLELHGLGALSNSARAIEIRVRLRELANNQATLRAELRENSPRFTGFRYLQAVSGSEALALLDPGTVMLSYSVGPDSTICFVVSADHGAAPALTTFVVSVSAVALRSKVAAFRALLENEGDLSRVTKDGTELYDLLIKPAEATIQRGKRLLISPDGPLHSLPFCALVASAEPEATPIYLGAQVAIHVVSSATVYAELKKTRSAHPAACGTLVAFGDPEYRATESDPGDALPQDPDVAALTRRGVHFTPLPGTRREVEAVAKLFGSEARVFLGTEATKTRARAVTSGTQFIHFACHGVLDEHFPFDSALVLSLRQNSDSPDNGLLQAREIIENMRLDADLVTLSACNSALGAELGGEGLVGLTLAFEYAGARSVLGSLWSVADESTALLMEAFYSGLCHGASKDEALRAAQIAMMHAGRFKHPFYWAAFEIIGDWR